MPRTYPSEAEACLSLNGKTLNKALVQKERKLMTLLEYTNQREGSKDQKQVTEGPHSGT